MFRLLKYFIKYVATYKNILPKSGYNYELTTSVFSLLILSFNASGAIHFTGTFPVLCCL